MRKLLTLLASLSLTVSTGLLVVACNDPADDIDKTPVDPEIEKEFIEELQSIPIKVSQLLSNRLNYSMMIEDGETEKYDFFRLEYLTKKFPIDVNDENVKTIDLKKEDNSSEYINKMISDLGKLFNEDDYIKMLDGAFGKEPSYQKMYLGAKQTLGAYHLDKTSPFNLKVQAIPNDESDKKGNDPFYTIDLTFYRIMNYKNREETPYVLNSTPKQLKLTISKKGAFVSALKKVQLELPSQIFQSTIFSTQLKFLSLQKQAQANNLTFKNYGNLEKAMRLYILSTEFQENLERTINRIWTDASVFGVPELDKINDENLIMETTKTMLDSTSWNSVKDLGHFKENALVNSLIMKSNTTKNWMKAEPAIEALKYSVNSTEGKYKTFNKELDNFLIQNTINEAAVREKMINETYSYGTFALNNAKILINVSGQTKPFEFDINVDVPWIYSNDEQDSQNNIKMNKIDTFFYAMYNSLKVVNKYMLQINPDEDKRTKTMFTISEELKKDYRNNQEWKMSWQKIKEKLDTNGGKPINISSENSNVPWNNITHFVIGEGSKNKEVKKQLDDDKNFKFEGFKSYLNLRSSHYDTGSFRKTTDGRYGFGFHDKIANKDKKVDLTYIVHLGKMRVNIGFPFGNSTGSWNGSGYEQYRTDQNFFGNDLNQTEFIDAIKSDIKNFLLFEFD